MPLQSINDLEYLLTKSRFPAQTAIPVMLQSSGTMGNNGALSAITALPTTYTSCYMYFPVDKIAAGVPAGLYYAVMSSTTAATIYNNTYDPTLGLMPTIPTNPIPFVTTGPGAYVQTTAADITLLGCKIPGGAMGKNGSVDCNFYNAYNNSAGAKTFKMIFGGALYTNAAGTTTIGFSSASGFANAGVTNKQVQTNIPASGGYSTTATTATSSTVDTTADANITLTAQLATATDFAILQRFIGIINYGA